MKKILLLMLLFTGFVNGQIINFPDANLKATLLSASTANYVAVGPSGYGPVDTNADGEIQVSEALAITALQFQSTAIIDFAGIENFVNLNFFGSYNNNNVVDFHLTGFTQLTTINISGNNDGCKLRETS